jgi:hypothetical protein
MNQNTSIGSCGAASSNKENVTNDGTGPGLACINYYAYNIMKMYRLSMVPQVFGVA